MAVPVGGKTFGMILKWIQHHELYGHIHPNAARGIIFRREIPQLDGFISECKGILPDLGWTYKAGKKYFVHDETQSHLFLRHMESDDDAAKYQGQSFSFVGIEELGDFPSQTKEGTNIQVLGTAVKKIKGCLRSVYGARTTFMATANPGGKCHTAIRNEYITPADPMTQFVDPETGLERIYIPSLLENNQKLMLNDPDYERRLLGTGPEWLVKAWRCGDWTISPEGNAFKREHFRYCRMLPLRDYWKIIHSWDTAYQNTKNADRSACTIWGVTKDGYHLLHAWAGRVEFPELKKMAVNLHIQFPADAVFIENKASGISLIQELKRETRLPVIKVDVDTNKMARAYAVTPVFEAGKIFLPEPAAPWSYDYLDELTAFPTREQDDFVDSTSQAISRLKHYQNLMFNTSNVRPFNAHSLYSM